MYEYRKMVGIYFSGTGNSKYAAELFSKEYDNESCAYSIEEKELLFTALWTVIVTGFAITNRLRRWAKPISDLLQMM